MDAQELINAPSTEKIFDGFRGFPPIDRRALEEILLRLSALAADV